MDSFLNSYFNDRGIRCSEVKTNICVNRRLNREEALEIIAQLLDETAKIKIDNDIVTVIFDPDAKHETDSIARFIEDCNDIASINLFQMLTNDYLT